MTPFDWADFIAPLLSWAPLMSIIIGTALGWLILRSGTRLHREHYVWLAGGAVAFFGGLSVLRSLEGSDTWERLLATLILWLLFEAGMAAGQGWRG